MTAVRITLVSIALLAFPAFGEPQAASTAPAAVPPAPAGAPAQAIAQPGKAKAPADAKKAPPSAPSAAAEAPAAPVDPRFKQVQDRIAYLFHTDVDFTPLTSLKSNPFRIARADDSNAAGGSGKGSAGASVGGDDDDGGKADANADSDSGGPNDKADSGADSDPDMDPDNPARPKAVVVAPASPAAALGAAIGGLRIEGISVLNGVTRISIAGLLHREGDFVRTRKNGKTVWLQIIQLTPSSVTFAYRDAPANGPKLTIRM